MVSGYTIKKICYKALRITSNNKIITENSSPSLRHKVTQSHFLIPLYHEQLPHAPCTMLSAPCTMRHAHHHLTGPAQPL